MAIGSYQGVSINAGTDAEVAAQIAAIDAKSSSPTTTNQVTSVPGFETPNITPTSGDISGATASNAGADKYLAEYQGIVEKQQADALKREELRTKTTQSLFDKYIKGSVSPLQARQEAQTSTGIIPAEYFADQKARIAEIDRLSQDYNAVVMSRDQQIAGARDAFGSNNFIDNRVAQINRNAAPKLLAMSANINARTATMQALQGNFREAQSFVNQAVQDATADLKYRFDMFSATYDMNRDLWGRLDNVYGDAMKSSIEIARTKYEEARKDKTAIGNLMIENPQAGILITDTLDEALSKVGLSPKAQKGEIFGSADTGYFERYYDAATNTYKTRSVSGGTSSTGPGSKIVTRPDGTKTTQLDMDAQAYLDGTITEADFGSSKEELSYFRSIKQRAIELANEALSSEPQPTRAPNTSTAYSLGREFGDDLSPLVEGPKNLLGGIANTVGGFFSGIFSR